MTGPATAPPARTTVFLVDDHGLFRSGVRAELDRSVPDVTVVGEAGSVAEAVAGIAHLRPDVVLLDVHMPDGGGAEPGDPAANATSCGCSPADTPTARSRASCSSRSRPWRRTCRACCARPS